jgi:hypothetical protein
MPRKIAELTNLEIGRLRANLSRKVSAIGNRLTDNALGTLTDNDKQPIEMTAGQLKAAEILIKNTLPAQAASTVLDLTPPEPRMEDLERDYLEAIASMPATDLKQVLDGMSKEERKALIQSCDETTQ